MASERRWEAAQDAERKHFDKYIHSRKDINPPPESRFFSQNFLLEDSDFFKKKSILEVGCSPAAIIHSLEEARFRVGIDPLVNEWRWFYPKGTYHIQAVGEDLPFKDETFDIVLCLNTLDHVKSPLATLTEVYRVLKRGGSLLLFLQTYSTLKIVRKSLGLVDRPHPHHLSHSDVASMLQNLGFNVSYSERKKPNLNCAGSLIKRGLIMSGLKSLAANLFLGLHNSSYACSKSM